MGRVHSNVTWNIIVPNLLREKPHIEHGISEISFDMSDGQSTRLNETLTDKFNVSQMNKRKSGIFIVVVNMLFEYSIGQFVNNSFKNLFADIIYYSRCFGILVYTRQILLIVAWQFVKFSVEFAVLADSCGSKMFS